MVKASRAIRSAAGVTAVAVALLTGEAAAHASAFPVTTRGQAMAIDPAGRSVVAAIGQPCRVVDHCGYLLLVARFEPNGKLDRSFARRGVARQPLPVSPPDAAVTGMAIDSKGRTVVAAHGLGSSSGEYPTMTIARFTRNGGSDQTFGHQGTTVVSSETFYPGFFGQKLAVDGIGRVLIAGTASATGGIAALRLLADGTPDPSFGDAGVASLRIDPDAIEERGSAVATVAGGGIVVAGTVQVRGDYHADVAAVAFTDAGVADVTFGGGDGVTSFPWHPAFNAVIASVGRLLVDARSRLVMVGSAAAGIHPCDIHASARLTPDGALDPSYASGGIAFRQLPSCGRPADAFIDGAGRLTVPIASPSRIVLVRQDTAGALDQSFGDDGMVGMRLEKTNRSSVGAVARTPAGRILAAGYAESDRCTRTGTSRLSSCTALLLTRFTPRGELDPRFGTNGVVTKPAIVPR